MFGIKSIILCNIRQTANAELTHVISFLPDVQWNLEGAGTLGPLTTIKKKENKMTWKKYLK